MMKKRILVVEDDAALARVLRDNLTFDGFDVQCVGEGSAALQIVREFTPDLVVLDLMLPGMSGFELCGLLRQRGRTPIMILTARGQKTDKLRGLNLGADDYVTKPFDLEEFLARVRGVLRRSGRRSSSSSSASCSSISARSTRRARTAAASHAREFELLLYLAERARTRRAPTSAARGLGYADAWRRARSIAIARLRKKIETTPTIRASSTRSTATATADARRARPEAVVSPSD